MLRIARAAPTSPSEKSTPTVRITLIRPPAVSSLHSYSVAIVPPLGPAYVAAALESAGHHVTVIDALGEAPLARHPSAHPLLRRARPDDRGRSSRAFRADVAGHRRSPSCSPSNGRTSRRCSAPFAPPSRACRSSSAASMRPRPGNTCSSASGGDALRARRRRGDGGRHRRVDRRRPARSRTFPASPFAVDGRPHRDRRRAAAYATSIRFHARPGISSRSRTTCRTDSGTA